jgi:hypothetical protein
MWLIDTTTLKLKSFVDDYHTPPYAILSHTWGDNEVIFTDMESTRAQDHPGFDKIRLCCKQAKEEGFEYAWVDT